MSKNRHQCKSPTVDREKIFAEVYACVLYSAETEVQQSLTWFKENTEHPLLGENIEKQYFGSQRSLAFHTQTIYL